MIRIHVFCEGPTEETFVRDVLVEHFSPKNIFLNPILIRTSKKGKGGVSTYGKIKRQIEIKCKEDTGAIVTTMFDYYQFPDDCPGYCDIPKIDDPCKIAEFIESEIQKDVNLNNFIPNLMMHEFESILFTNPGAFEDWFDETSVNLIKENKKKFETPEHINNNIETAPSKRILKCCSGYQKVLHGTLIALDIGLEAIRRECKHFNNWIEKLESLKV